MSDSQKTPIMGAFQINLIRYENKETDFVAEIVSCDETCFHHFDPAFKGMSMEWRYSHIPRPKKPVLSRNPEKGTLSFFDGNGFLLIERLKQGAVFNSEVETLRHM